MINKNIKFIQVLPLSFFKNNSFKIKEEILSENLNLEDYVKINHAEKIFLYLQKKEYNLVLPELYVQKEGFKSIELNANDLKSKFKIFVARRKKYKKIFTSVPHQFHENHEELKRLGEQLQDGFEIADILMKLGREKGIFQANYAKNAKKEANSKLKEKNEEIEKEWKEKVRVYHEMFLVARKMKRKVKLFIGPTNSGKTWNALNELVSHGSGVYLAPLRLLALEGKEEVETRGQPCSFITGEEREIVEGAKFSAQTIETFNYNKNINAVLIDEVQLISDSSRGWAWTQALVGAPAENIILTGSLDCREMIIYVCKMLGDELEIVDLQRHTNLNIKKETVSFSDSEIKKLEENTAIIVFSRKSVINLKYQFERNNIPVSIIYGNLSPDVRREEARKFRSGETKYLISTDAIAMGLNLPVKQVVFAETEKFNGEDQVPLTPNEVRQIAGRAGRYKMFDTGYVSALNEKSLEFIRESMSQPTKVEKVLFVRPTWEQIEFLSSLYSNDSLSFLLKKFYKLIQRSQDIYQCADLNQTLELSDILDEKPLTLQQKYEWSMVPIDVSTTSGMVVFKNWINCIVQGKEIKAEPFYQIPLSIDYYDQDYMFQAEINVKILTAYAWLAFHKPEVAPELEHCQHLKSDYNDFIIRSLSYKMTHKKCKDCLKKIPLDYEFNICQACFVAMKSQQKKNK